MSPEHPEHNETWLVKGEFSMFTSALLELIKDDLTLEEALEEAIRVSSNGAEDHISAFEKAAEILRALGDPALDDPGSS